MAKKESQDGKSKKGLPRLMELAMTQKAPMVGGMILSAMATIASFLPYLAIYFIIQEVVGAYPDFGVLDVPKVLGYGGMALGGVLLNVLLYTASVALSHIAAYGTLYQCKINYVSHITKLPLGYHLKMGSGKLRKVMDDNIESLEGFIAHDLPNMISAFIAPVVMLVLVFAVDWRFGLATFVGIIVSFLVYGATSGGNKTKKLMEDYQTSLEDMSNASVEYIAVEVEWQSRHSLRQNTDAGIHRRHLHRGTFIDTLARRASSKEKAVGTACSTVLGLIPGTEKPGKETHLESPSFLKIDIRKASTFR